MELDFKRAVTHVGYEHVDKLKKYYHRVNKQITEIPENFDDSELINNKQKKNSWYLDENYMYIYNSGAWGPLIYGLVTWVLTIVLILGYYWNGKLEPFEIFLFLFCGVISVFQTIYYFTRPKKEEILNRRDGLITMPGLYWKKNITIAFEQCLFAYSTGGEDGTSAFNLEVIRPTESRFNTFAEFSLGQAHCYVSMSLITWYMDKNRPLPPGTAFDAYRERDYQRRKAAGFPRPLYPGIATSEATKEQQKERMAIGGW